MLASAWCHAVEVDQVSVWPGRTSLQGFLALPEEQLWVRLNQVLVQGPVLTWLIPQIFLGLLQGGACQ